jgi:pimeloyl-ACP methyl ester carboxylesterase
MSTFVLLHGGNHGGWCYKWLSTELRRRGHEAYAPTLTGHGERVHLQAPDTSMETHVLDVANLIHYEDLEDVVLVGHSMGGVTIPLVAERMKDRIRRVVWLAAVVLADGESIGENYMATSEFLKRALARMEEGLPPDKELLMDAFLQDGTPEQRRWVEARLGGGTTALITEKGDLTRFLQLGLPTGYVLATRDQSLPPELCRVLAARLPGCRFAEVDADHDLMVTHPDATADALVSMAR